MTMKVWVLLFALAMSWCFSTEAALTRKHKSYQMRGASDAAPSKKADANKTDAKKADANDDDDDDDDDDDADDAVDPRRAKLTAALNKNLKDQTNIKDQLAHLSDEVASDGEIDAQAKKVVNETQSPAMANMLGKMWKELRMFEMPSYTEHLRARLTKLKTKEQDLEAQLSGGKSASAAAPAATWGHNDCKCIGIDDVDGQTVAALKDGTKLNYPADLGARCEAWDLSKHPKCPGASWCKQKWCYVDPCKCKISTLPKPSVYVKGAQYQGKPVHFSYATCGGKDSYSADEDKKVAADIKKTCSVSVDDNKWGEDGCRCVGIGPQPGGNVMVTIKDKQVSFPGDTGSTCQKWEEENHPDCQGDNAPDWCTQKWCYVDPCSCSGAQPKTSAYLPDSNYQGKPVYYSYDTCGGSDSYTASEHKKACVNNKDDTSCAKNKKCAWTGKECLGKELVDVCGLDQPKSAAFRTNFELTALLLPLLALLRL